MLTACLTGELRLGTGALRESGADCRKFWSAMKQESDCTANGYKINEVLSQASTRAQRFYRWAWRDLENF
jgi:hypothetical protein